MSRPIHRALPLLAGLVGLWPASGGAQFGPGAYPPQQHQPMVPEGQYRPLGPSNARGAPPGYPGSYPGPYPSGSPGVYPGYPGAYPGGYPHGQTPRQQPYPGASGYYPQPARPQVTTQPPRMELELNNRRPYAQQNVLLTLRIISGATLQTLDPILPQNEGLMFNQIKQPTAYSRPGPQGRQEIVNTLVYLVTPMRAGSIEVPRVSALVQQEGGGGSLTVQAPQPLRLEVQPVDPRVNPWLPLEHLAITSNLDAPLRVEPGKPVSLILKLSATGATGGQLPTLEGLLQSPDFRVYRGKTETEGGLSQNGRHILGSRTEHYTLVPQYGGALRLPSARISWFNVVTGTVEHTSLPVKTLTAAGKGAGLERFFGGDEGSSLFPSGYASAFWLPLLGILLLMLGYWLGVWYRDRRGGPGPAAGVFRALGAGLGRRLGTLRKRLRPAPHWSRAMARLAGILPTPVRFWFWVRRLDAEQDPGLWIRTLQFMSWRQLSLSPYATLSQMAERIIEFQQSADPERVRELFRELDGALYGHQPLDFPRWKQAFKRQARPGPRAWLSWRRAPPTAQTLDRLPALNPHHV